MTLAIRKEPDIVTETEGTTSFCPKHKNFLPNNRESLSFFLLNTHNPRKWQSSHPSLATTHSSFLFQSRRGLGECHCLGLSSHRGQVLREEAKSPERDGHHCPKLALNAGGVFSPRTVPSRA
ncbi:hypothetical protein VFPPC_18115 [Pochonia chlamydosporia 170]|uniref:Uncharacterized protein n=1 Tax=Pochonia chlamydosporia 170 TaxID=1380566 RepID=A0A219AQ57_METCM|nr:hypothetical protein VFPPC_18115 [Pochonia chlamydosporia 170]OWT42702.1 hypothetical protein VFPPC_18115 [Pochonia chlamydosporia 170]